MKTILGSIKSSLTSLAKVVLISEPEIVDLTMHDFCVLNLEAVIGKEQSEVIIHHDNVAGNTVLIQIHEHCVRIQTNDEFGEFLNGTLKLHDQTEPVSYCKLVTSGYVISYTNVLGALLYIDVQTIQQLEHQLMNICKYRLGESKPRK